MSNAIATQPTLAQTVWQAEGAARWMRNVVLVLAGTAILAISAKINVPMLPVPMTMQTFAVLLIAMAYGWRLGAATIIAYLPKVPWGFRFSQGAVAWPIWLARRAAIFSALCFRHLLSDGWLNAVGATFPAPSLRISLVRS